MTKEHAKKAALHILDDRNGADFYKDVKILSSYLEGTLGMTKDKADQIANDIQEDRKGSNYYKNAEILAGILANRD